MATQHSTQKQKTITVMCNQPGGAVVRVSPSTARIAMELDTLGAPELNEMMRVIRAIKAGLFNYSATEVAAWTLEQRRVVVNSLPEMQS